MIFVSTSCLSGQQRLVDRLRLFQSYGLDSVELGQNVTLDKNGLSQLLEMEGRFLVHNYFPPPSTPFVLNLASKDSNIRQQSLNLVRRALALTRRLNAPFYSVHAGFITDPISFEKTSFVFPMPASPSEKQFAINRFTAALKAALERAKQLDVHILIENNVCTCELLGKLLLQTADEFLVLFRALSSQYLGILLDTGHLNVTAHTFGFDHMDFVDQVAPYIRAFHISDNDGTKDSGQPVRANSWMLDVLHRPEFSDLPIVIESKFETVADLRQYVDWLKAELRRE